MNHFLTKTLLATSVCAFALARADIGWAQESEPQGEQLELEGTESIAGTFRYTYFESGWVKDEVDDLEVRGDGFALSAGMALSSNWHLFGSYSVTNLDLNGGGTQANDSEFGTAGVGYNYAVRPTWDVIARIGAARYKLGEASEDGYMAQAGARGLVFGRLELEGLVQHTNFDRASGSDTAFLAAARYNFTPWFSLGVGGSVGGDITEYGFNLRWSTGL